MARFRGGCMTPNVATPIVLTSPFLEDDVRALRAGEAVSLSGALYTGRDRLHKFLHEGGESPVSLQNGGLYHCGPVVLREGEGWRIVAAGPTTSIREEPYMADLIARFGIRVVIGKGGMGSATREACREHGCVYLQAVGGAAARLAQAITAVTGVFFLPEFGSAEAMWALQVRGFEAIVAMDAHGRSLYDAVREDSRAKLAELM